MNVVQQQQHTLPRQRGVQFFVRRSKRPPAFEQRAKDELQDVVGGPMPAANVEDPIGIQGCDVLVVRDLGEHRRFAASVRPGKHNRRS